MPTQFNWRFQVPDGEAISFTDGNLGPQTFVAGKDFGDFVVWRHDDVPAYQLACVADDAAMQIREIMRVAKEDYGLLSLTDVVLNHTANDSPWLIHHPEAGKFTSLFPFVVLTMP